VQKRTLDDTDINPELSARWLRHAHASRVLDIFRAVSKGVSAELPRQRRRAAHALAQTLKIWPAGELKQAVIRLSHWSSRTEFRLSCGKENALLADVSCRNWSSRSI